MEKGGGGGHINKIGQSVGRRENFWGISCEKSRFYAKKNIFFPIVEGGAKIVGVFRVKNHDFTPKNHIFSNFRGGARRVRLPLDPPLGLKFKVWVADVKFASFKALRGL